MKEVSEICDNISGHGFFDFGKDAYAQLEVELTGEFGENIELVIGEVAKNGKIVHEAGWTTFQIDNIALKPGTQIYRFNIPKHLPAYSGFPHLETPSEYGGEIAPFRYVEVNHYYGKLKVCRSTFFKEWDDNASHFECSDKKLNEVWELCKYSIKATAIFDCYIDGERERMPYEGDAYINQLGHFCCGSNYTIAKNTIDHFFKYGEYTWPTEWILLTPLLVRDYYLYSGDAESLKRWLPCLPEKLLPKLVNKDGLLRGNDKIRDIVDWPASDRDGYEFGEVNFVPNAYYYRALKVMHELTASKEYLVKAESVKKSLRKLMLKNGLFVDNPKSTHTSLHTAMFALLFGLTNCTEIENLKSVIRKKGMACSVYSAQFLLDSCYENNMSNHAFSLMTGNSLHSWQNMLNRGSTITTEGWTEEGKPFHDWTHAWGAAPANIIPRFIAGIRPVEAGFDTFSLEPNPGSLEYFKLRHPTRHGAIELDYAKGTLHINIPTNSKCIFSDSILKAGKHKLIIKKD